MTTARTLEVALAEHLAQEEMEVLPLTRDHLTVAEWDPAHADALAAGPTDPTSAPMRVGTVLEDADQAERAWFLSLVATPARLLWGGYGARRYQRYSRDRLRSVAR